MQSETKQKPATFPFLQGGGEMGELTRNFDWSKTPVGAPDAWPQSLRTTVGILLNSRFPMFLFWGDNLIQFYNDAYRPSLGVNGKHPVALGQRAEECFPEIWPDIKPLLDQVRAGGGATWAEDRLLPFYRNGQVEDIYWTFSYSPVIDDEGKIGGVLTVCSETTEKVKARNELTESKEDLAFAIEAAELATWDFNPITNQFTADARYTEWFGLTAEQATDNTLSLAIIAEEDRKRVLVALANALDPVTGDRYDIEYTIRPNGKPERILRAKGKAWFTEQGIAYRLTGILQDITEQVTSRRKTAESEARFRSLIEASPVATGLLVGRELRITVANETIIHYWGKRTAVIGLTLEEALPELKGQPFLQILDNVFTTGKPYKAVETEVWLVINGVLSLVYFDFTYTPLFDSKSAVYAIMVTAVDVKEKVSSRKKLEESERNLRNTILQSPVAMCILKGKDNVVEIANERIYELWGAQGREIIGKSIFDALPEVANQGFEALLAHVYATGETYKASGVPLTTANNRGGLHTIYIDFLYEAYREADGAISGIIAVAIDVTEQAAARKKVEESEQKVRALVQSAPFPIATYIGREMRIEMANPSIADIWGKGPDVIGKLYADVLPELENQEIYEQLDAVYNTGKAFHARNRRVDLIVNGKIRPYYFNYSFTPLFDAAGKVYGVMNTAADVTDLNLAKQKIEESEARFRNMVKQASVAIMLTRGMDVVIESINEPMLKFLGKKSEGDVLGKKMIEVLPELEGQLGLKIVKKVAATGEAFSAYEVPVNLVIEGTLTECFFDLSYTALKEENSETGVLHVAMDVTQQVMARKKIEENSRELQLAIEVADLGTFHADLLQDKVVYSGRIMDSFGITQQGLSMNTLLTAIHPEDQARCKTAIENASRPEANGRIDITFRVVHPKAGSIHYLRSFNQIVLNNDGQAYLMVGVIQDITQQTLYQEHLKASEQDLQRKVEERTCELESINNELKRSNQNLEEFAHAASHDLKEPIRKIHFFTDRLKHQLEERITPEEKFTFNRIESASQRMSALIDDLLLYSHVTQRPHEKEEVDLNVKIKKVLEDLELDILQKSAVITSGKLPIVKGYRRQLQQLFQNLISNALKYSKPGVAPKIEITSKVVNGLQANIPTGDGMQYYLIEVGDNGIGFEQENADRIFQMFQRLHGNTEYRGTGVGLSIVKKVVENHNGKIVAESSPGNGATFKVYLPA